MQLHSSSLKDNCDSNLIFCVISVGEKVIKSTEAMDVKSLMMNDPIKITANSHSPLESHVTIEVQFFTNVIRLIVLSFVINSALLLGKNILENAEFPLFGEYDLEWSSFRT